MSEPELAAAVDEAPAFEAFFDAAVSYEMLALRHLVFLIDFV